jgi:two-component system response regulator FixJ
LKPSILIVDDEAGVRSALSGVLRDEGYGVEAVESGEACLDRAMRVSFDAIVLDIWLPGLDGLATLAKLQDRRVDAPVIMISGHGNIESAVRAIKIGAFDFIEKPFDENRLLASIRTAVEAGRRKTSDAAELEELQSRFNSLSARQRQVMELTVSGLSNKEIALQLDISAKTVENHRAWVMERIGARNLADLVRMAMQIRPRT